MDSLDREQNAQNPEYTPDTNEEIIDAVSEEAEETPAEAAAEPEAQPYVGNGAGRKESPFADSPYVMNHHQQQTEDVPPQAPPVSKKTSKSGNKVGKRVLAAVLALSVVAGGCGITAAMVNNHWEKETAAMTASFNKQMNDLKKQFTGHVTKDPVTGELVSFKDAMTPSQVYAQNVDSVVAITAVINKTHNGKVFQGGSTGSGFILTQDGYIVSNHHVIEGGTDLTVTTHDGTEYKATLVGSDAFNDIALLKIDATDLQAVTIGSSDELLVGDQVVAIGNPLGELTATQTVGYISAKERVISTDGSQINMMQTDAAINSGNSGGPLFNMRGEVVGITTAKYSGSSSSGASIEGIGFAIPIDDVYPMLESIRENGYVTGPQLGVSVYSMDHETASRLGLPLGALVDSVTPGSCAEKAGVQPTDIVIALGEHKVQSNMDLTRALRKFKGGETTTITVFRSGQEVSLPITLDEKPNTTAAPSSGNNPSRNDPNLPENGSYEEWYNYFAPFFGFGK